MKVASINKRVLPRLKGIINYLVSPFQDVVVPVLGRTKERTLLNLAIPELFIG